VGDLVGFIRYILAMRRFGLNHLLRNGRLEIEAFYAYEAHHDLSVTPNFHDYEAEMKQQKLRSEQEKNFETLKTSLKYPTFEDQPAPHIVAYRASFPLHPEGDPPTPWRFSEIDGMKRTEIEEVRKIVRLSANHAKDIDAIHPALRMFSKDYFTSMGPTQGWYEERERLKRVAFNRATRGVLEDDNPDLKTTPIGQLFKHQDEVAKKADEAKFKDYREKAFGKIDLGQLGDVDEPAQSKEPKQPL